MTVIRPAKLPDLTRMAGMDGLPESSLRRARSALVSRAAHLLVAEYNGDLPGMVLAQLAQQGRSGQQLGIWQRVVRFLLGPDPEPKSLVQPLRLGLIQDLYVALAWRRQGVATALLAACEGWFQARQVLDIQISISAADQSAQAFLQSRGYKPRRYLVERSL